ncbi:type II toxin-antitoxin system HicB family antitoxin [bacterium]|nr:type II toxin-antitoxin system HicB family antitoxin [bacterium]
MRNITPIVYSVEKGFVGFAAELPGATGQGKTIEETVTEIKIAVEELIEEYQSRKVENP